MKGLLMKDLRVLWKSKKLVIGILFVASFLLTVQGKENYTFIIGYVTMVCGMLVLNTVSVDDYEKCNAFLMTMPVDSGICAAEKYLFSFVCGLCGWLLATGACIAIQPENAEQVLLQAAAVFLVILFFQWIMLPVQWKYGGEKGRIVLIGLIASCVIIALLLDKAAEAFFPGQGGLEGWLLQISEQAAGLELWMIGLIACVVWAAGGVISFGISKKVLSGKEY